MTLLDKLLDDEAKERRRREREASRVGSCTEWFGSAIIWRGGQISVRTGASPSSVAAAGAAAVAARTPIPPHVAESQRATEREQLIADVAAQDARNKAEDEAIRRRWEQPYAPPRNPRWALDGSARMAWDPKWPVRK